jgi:hypothetical protein
MMAPFIRSGLFRFAVLAGAGWMGGASVPAAMVLGNLNQPSVDGTEAVSLNQWQASAIRLAPEAGAWRVSSLKVRLSQRTANRSFFFRIVGESAFRPDLAAVKVNFAPPALTGSGPQQVTVAALIQPAPVLQPGQTYWIVAGVATPDNEQTPGTGLYHWSFSTTNSADAPAQAGWSFDSRIATSGTTGQNWDPLVATPFSFALEAAPELASMTLARWRELHPGGALDSTVYLAADHDGNGLNGLLDFAFDATRANLPVIGRDASSGGLFLEYVRWTEAPELLWQIQHSTDLQNWLPLNGLTSSSTAAGAFSQRIRVQLPGAAAESYYRLSVLKR